MKADPGRIGLTTGRSRERLDVTLWQVQFMDGSIQYVPEDQMEVLGDSPRSPLDMLEEGRVGRPIDLRRTLTHVRLTGRLADIIYSMDITGTDFYAYQFKPVIKLLESSANGILIADEVGLGKTIESGLIWTELRSRFDFRRIFVLCPAFLREKWRREMQVRFGVSCEILNARDTLRRFEEAAQQGPLASFAIIASMQGLRPKQGWNQPTTGESASNELMRFLTNREEDEPLIDLLVIDEAHYLRNPYTKTTALGRHLRNIAQYVALLSATPIHLGSKDLLQLLQLIDEDTFVDSSSFDSILSANAPLVRLREEVLAGTATSVALRTSLECARTHPILAKNRQLRRLLDDLPSDEQLDSAELRSHLAYRLEKANLLGHVLTRTRKRDVTEWRVLREAKAVAVSMTEPERRFYEAVTNTVRRYCAQVDAHEGFLLVMPQRQMSSSMPAALASWQARAGIHAEEYFEDLGAFVNDEETSRGPLLQELIAESSTFGEYKRLKDNDSKYRALLDRLKRFFRTQRDDKVVVFSFFRATLEYLSRRLSADGIANTVLKGGDPDQERVLDKFRARSGPRVLLSSEVGSEGIDLQFCWVVINYDLPWNPMRIEQRIGRLDRLGQRAEKIQIRSFFYADTIDARIHDRLLHRLGVFERALGSLEDIIGTRIRELTLDLLRQDLTPEDERLRIDQTAQALENISRHEEELEREAAHLVAYGDYILNQVQAARELSRKIESSDLLTYVTDFLKAQYPGTHLHLDPRDPMLVHIRLSNKAQLDFESFMREARLQTNTRLLRNDSTLIPCRFKNTTVTTPESSEETINQFHPIVRFVSHHLSSMTDGQHLAIATILRRSRIPASLTLEPGDYVFSVQRWSVRGIQDSEKLYYAVARLHESQLLSPTIAERLVVAAASSGEDWLSASTDLNLQDACKVVNDVCLASSDEEYAQYVQELQARNDDQADVQEATLNRRFDRTYKRMQEVLEQHRLHNRVGLAKATEGQMAKLENRVRRERLRIAERRRLKHSKVEVCVGLIRVCD